MTPRVEAAPVTDLPAGTDWDFGGFAYGLEPLVLPAVGEPDALRRGDPAADGGGAGYADACRLVRLLGEGGAPPPEVDPDTTAEELYWFRWITGHQVCFVIWRLMGQLLDEVDRGATAPEAALEPICRYVDGYSAMLLYTGSCPRDSYEALIRPSMRLRHRGFSGTWAPDYTRVRELFRGRRPSPVSSVDSGELHDAVRMLNVVHDGVAAKLVPDGRSLLNQASVRRLNHGLVGMIYDSYFMTTRMPVARPEVVAQLLRRLVAIARDIAANGLRAAEDRDALPEELLRPEVVKCENGLVEILFEVGRFASGVAPPEHAAPLRRDVPRAAAEAARR
jgi:hypothetical protein